MVVQWTVAYPMMGHISERGKAAGSMWGHNIKLPFCGKMMLCCGIWFPAGFLNGGKENHGVRQREVGQIQLEK